ncbi:uncharacterized protein LOC143859528 [Tasmannia lanceolata]|uniref:uncharacterized protein LOC143859528 n=1 Tax=Tasmannia lanceolata TaxID=3420 RepID=UPI004062FFDF
MAARKLRPYFQAHTIKVLTDQPLKQVLHRPDTSGRLVKWAVELSEFDIQYLRRQAIKAQVLADFVAECTIPQQSIASEAVKTPVVEEITTPGGQVKAEAATPVRTESATVPAEKDVSSEALWEVYVDGSSSKSGCGADLILTGPENFILDYALRFGFRASNNETEYEALIARMNLAVQTRAQRLRAYCNSQLIANQIQGVYEAGDERMIRYLAKVRLLASKFKSFEVIRIPRTENTKADVLSNLAASGYTALGSICMEFLKKSSIDNKAVEIMQVDHKSCRMDEIIDYLRSGKLPEGKKEARKVIQRAARSENRTEIHFCGAPQTNGQTEVTNRILLQGIKKRLDEKAGRWADELYHVMWAYRTTPPTTTGESPFNLSFGTEAVIPVDAGVPSSRVANFNKQLNGSGLRENLDLLEEVREESRIRVAAYKQKVSYYHDEKIRPREF